MHLFREPTDREWNALVEEYGQVVAERALYLARRIDLRLDMTIREMLIGERLKLRGRNRV